MYVGLAAGQSYTFSVWMRSQTGQPVKGHGCVAGASGRRPGGGLDRRSPSAARGRSSRATVIPSRGDYTILRGQVYVDTRRRAAAGRRRAADRPTGWPTRPSRQADFASWDRFPRGALSARRRRTRPAAREGTAYGAVRTGAAGRSFAQDVGVADRRRRRAARSRSGCARPPAARGVGACSPALGGSEEIGGDAVLPSARAGRSSPRRWTPASAIAACAPRSCSTRRAPSSTSTPRRCRPATRATTATAPVPARRRRAAAPPAPDADGDGVPDASDLCETLAGAAARRGCPRGLANDTSIAYRRSGTGIRVVRYYVAATKGARVVVACSKKAAARRSPRARAPSGCGSRGLQPALKSGTKVTVTVSVPAG